jgi:gamma-tubulin complex component 2
MQLEIINTFLLFSDPSFKDLAERILPLATYYTSIDAFIEKHSRFEYGFVSHALCAAMRGLLKVFIN